MALHALHLCSGYAGFELALRHAGIDARTVCHVEQDAHAAATLVERMGEARLDQAPCWDDLTTFDGRPWRGRVDLITASLPCQPFSAAGKRAGVDDRRHLWPMARRIIADVRPGLVMLENVPDIVRVGWLDRVLADLACLGFDAEWGVLSAVAVGAPHRRNRFWLLAHANGEGRGQEWRQSVGRERDVDGRSGTHVADATGRGFPPAPDDTDGWQRWLADGGPEPAVRRRTDGPPVGLADQLHLGGNGLVPQCAAEAFHQLADRACLT